MTCSTGAMAKTGKWRRRKSKAIMDFLVVGVALISFAALIAFAFACERL